jgi:hypothetical protein
MSAAAHGTDRRWGVILPDGTFRHIPEVPMRLAGLGPPPFDVTRPDGEVLHIVEEPTDG